MLSHYEVSDLVWDENLGVLDKLCKLDGFYLCPKDPSGNRLGPLVGYAGRDEKGRQLVGDVYANFAVAEEVPSLMLSWAQRMELLLFPYLNSIDVFLGAPRGGESFADKLGQLADRRYMYPEKRVIAVATASSRETVELVFLRHQLEPGQNVAIVEDVMNNFTTAGQLIDLVVRAGAQVTMLVGIFNRSPHVDTEFRHGDMCLPVFALVRQVLPEYMQDDPAVASDVAAGNVVWKPKDHWAFLMSAMQQSP